MATLSDIVGALVAGVVAGALLARGFNKVQLEDNNKTSISKGIRMYFNLRIL